MIPEFDIDITGEGLLTIAPSGPEDDIDTWLNAFVDALFWEDIYFYPSGQDGWTYLVKCDQVFPMDDYGYDLIRDLRAGHPVSVMARDNLPDYAEYEWNNTD
jgi:hypothetical protein